MSLCSLLLVPWGSAQLRVMLGKDTLVGVTLLPAGVSLAWPSSSSALPCAAPGAPEPASSPTGHRQRQGLVAALGHEGWGSPGSAPLWGPGVGALAEAQRWFSEEFFAITEISHSPSNVATRWGCSPQRAPGGLERPQGLCRFSIFVSETFSPLVRRVVCSVGALSLINVCSQPCPPPVSHRFTLRAAGEGREDVWDGIVLCGLVLSNRHCRAWWWLREGPHGHISRGCPEIQDRHLGHRQGLGRTHGSAGDPLPRGGLAYAESILLAYGTSSPMGEAPASLRCQANTAPGPSHMAHVPQPPTAHPARPGGPSDTIPCPVLLTPIW